MEEHDHGASFQHPDFFDTYFSPEAVDNLITDAGLQPVLRRSGHWRGDRYRQRSPHGYQDLLILKWADP
jgi:hypothetical protein